MYEAATNQLVGFLDLVSQQLSGIVPETESRLSGIAPASESRLSIDGLGSLGAFPHLQGINQVLHDIFLSNPPPPFCSSITI